MDNIPMVSIIIPIYNVENYIENCIKSVIAQTYKNIEIILVDDGTPDKSSDIAERVLTEKGVTYQIIHQENSGLAMSRNAGLNVAKGEWVYFLDSDDLILPSTIEHMVNACCDKEIDLVISSFKSIYSVNEVLNDCNNGYKKVYTREKIQKEFLLRKLVILAPGTLYRKNFLTNNNLKFEKLSWSEDQHFVWRVLAFINKAVYLDEPLYQYYRHEGSIMTATKANKIIESYKFICDLEYYYNESYVGKFLVARWVMGSLNSAVILTEFKDWKELYRQIEGRKHLRRLISFQDMKVKNLALCGYISPKLYYFIMKRAHNR